MANTEQKKTWYHTDHDLHLVAVDAVHNEDAVPIVDLEEFESIAKSALGEEDMYISADGELVIPHKSKGLRSPTRSGKMDSYKSCE